MALAVGDIVEIQDVQSFAGQLLLNVYHYRMESVSVDTDYQDIADAFQTGVISDMLPIQSTSLVHTRTIVKNLSNGVDIFEEPITLAGTSVGNGAPSFESLSFRLVRSSAITRHGAKRIGGLADQASTGNELVSSLVTPAATLAASMAAPIGIDAGGTTDFSAIPVIVGRYPQGHVDAGKLNLAVINPVASGSFIRVSTQVTRRAGRGA